MARVPKVARETISRGTPSLRNLPRNSGWILYFQKIAIKFRQSSCTKFQISPRWKYNIAKLIQNIPRATISFHTIHIVWKLTVAATVSWRVAQYIAMPINSLLSLKVSWARDSCLQMEDFHTHDDSEIDIWTIFWDEKQLFHAWLEYRFVRGSGHGHGKINNRSIRISYTNAVE